MTNNNLRLSQISLLTGLKRHTINSRAKTTYSDHELTRSPNNQILLHPAQVKTVIEDKLLNVKGKIIYIGNLKGGVGKTTIAYLSSQRNIYARPKNVHY